MCILRRWNRQSIFGVDPYVIVPRHDTEKRSRAQLCNPLQRRFKQRCIAAELIDDETADETLVLRIEERKRAVKRGEDAAPVDITDEDRRDLAVLCQSHIDVV